MLRQGWTRLPAATVTGRRFFFRIGPDQPAEEVRMGARDKLNQAYINGAMITGTVLGIVAESWSIFWIAVIYCLASSIHVGEIRFTGRGRKR
jgi:hypothetical protein